MNRFLKDETTEWRTSREGDQVTCHSRMVDGVLCRWWGDAEPPAGVKTIDDAVKAEARVKELEAKFATSVDAAIEGAKKIAKEEIDKLAALFGEKLQAAFQAMVEMETFAETDKGHPTEVSQKIATRRRQWFKEYWNKVTGQ